MEEGCSTLRKRTPGCTGIAIILPTLIRIGVRLEAGLKPVGGHAMGALSTGDVLAARRIPVFGITP